MERLLIYPYDEDFYSAMDYLYTKTEISISGLVVPKGSYLASKHEGYVNNTLDAKFIVTDDFDSALSGCDTVAFLKEVDANGENFMLFAQRAMAAQKNVICCFLAEDKIKEKLSSMAQANKCRIEYRYEKFIFDDEYLKEQNTFHCMYNPQCKVIFIGGLLENVDQKLLAFKLAAGMDRKGYTVSVIGEGSIFPFCGFHDFAEIWSKLKGDYQLIIKALNCMIKNIDTIEKPDILIINIPGELMQFNNVVCGDFGTRFYMLSEAVKSDYFICSLPFGEYTDEFCEITNKYFTDRFEKSVDLFHVSNHMLIYNESVERRDYVSFCCNISDVIRKTSENRSRMQSDLFNVHETDYLNSVTDKMISKLEDQ